MESVAPGRPISHPANRLDDKDRAIDINGQQVVKDSKFQKVWAGQPIRFPVEERGKHEPLTVEDWGRTFTISSFSVDDGGAKPDTANGGGK